MKKVAAKLITISSQMFIVMVFMFLLFNENKGSEKTITAYNANLNKMADSVSVLFKKEAMLLDDVDSSVISPLEDEKEVTKEEETVPKEEVVVEDTNNNNTTIEPTPSVNPVPLEKEPILTVVGNLTGYGPDCYGCSGITRSGHNLHDSVYYNDYEYGNIRILAADPSFGKYAIFRVSNVPGMEPFIAIVLDTGGNVGYNKGTLFDLAFATERGNDVIGLTNGVKFELLREGISW